jgi:phosphatidylglycerophosphate synthase
VIVRQIADILTGTRIFISGIIAWIGVTLPKEVGLGPVVWLTVLAWFTDSLDGQLARRSKVPGETWLSTHDFEVDLLLVLALAISIAKWGFPILLIISLLAILLWAVWHALARGGLVSFLKSGVWPNHQEEVAQSIVLQVPFLIVYVALYPYVFLSDTSLGLVLVAYLLLQTAFYPKRTWHRFRNFFVVFKQLLTGAANVVNGIEGKRT